MTKVGLIIRNKNFAIGVIKMVNQLPSNRIFDPLVRQVVRSSTSVGANYRAACRAKSTADFINKLKIVEEEIDETSYFLELLKEIDDGDEKARLKVLMDEVNELTTIYVSSLKTMRERQIVNRKS